MGKNNKTWPEGKQNYVIQEYLAGRTTTDIAKEIGTYNTSIRRVLVRHNISLISTGDRLRKVKYNPFEDLNNQNVQYWIGYLIADGCIDTARKTIRIHSKDIESLENFKNFLNAPVIIRQEFQKQSNSICNVISFNNHEAYDTLTDLGFTPSKSYEFTYNGNITWDLVRGYFDGDGCFYYLENAESKGKQRPKIIFTCGSWDFLNQIQQFLGGYDIHGKISQHGTYYNFTIVRKNDINLFYDHIYDNATYFLQRKYDKFGSYYVERRNLEAS